MTPGTAGPAPLSSDQFIALRLLSDPAHGQGEPALDMTVTDYWERLGSERFADALTRIDTMFNLGHRGIDPCEAVASGDIAGLLALVEAKTRPGRASIRRPGYVEVYDLTAIRAAIGRPIEASRFAHWRRPRLHVVGAPEPQGSEDPAPEPAPAAEREPDLAIDDGVLAQAFPDAAMALPADYLAAAVKAGLLVLALLMAASALGPPPIPPEGPAQLALRDAVR